MGWRHSEQTRAVLPTSSPTHTQLVTHKRTATSTTMPPVSQSLRSSVRCTRRVPRAVPQTFSRSASHGAPHYNEPTGFLFGEKVRSMVPPSPFCLLTSVWIPLAPGPWSETSERGLGVDLVCGHVRNPCCGLRRAVLQARHKVRVSREVS